ncbi:hypothetical protein [Vibrio navarrensis]|uniref:hypothetical protein n=1 Tax=Vibrio navarrensis TaxID=29495 RepID=UPI00051E064D|nr:hypothetical protein [Vibrio navarrensis]EGR2795656.1 hypothetical protein [Vibrio navarrensis]EJK2115893.1 hypothetical protein [Vibrio navarrensis]EJL6399797.1 hypothetical protein [Vibrio navarrensis]EJL6565086.1 hypothetical protein [Vibrio navarrensis]KGK20843.1 membrane protein [Vibrio navarrensis]
MVQFLLSSFAPMLLGAQLVLTLVLVKGDICPGQRGRIHKVLPALGLMWMAVSSLEIAAFLVVFAIFYFYSKVQTGKTRQEGPLWVLYLADGLALCFVALQAIKQSHWGAALVTVLLTVLLGAIFTHLLLVIARSRLQAFHRILPFSGIIAAMLTALALLGVASGFGAEQLEQVTPLMLASLVLMIVGVVMWCWHIFSGKAAHKIQLAIAWLMLLASASSMHMLFSLPA